MMQMNYGKKSSSLRLKTKNLKPLNDAKSNSSRGSSRSSSRASTARTRKKKKVKSQYPDFNPLLSVNTIFGKQNSTIHSLSSSLCVDALKQGCIDTFEEIFQLSHREPVLIDPVTEEFFSIGSNRLIQLQSEMCQAELKLRTKNYKEAYEIYRNVSEYLESEKDNERAKYFLLKGKEVAISSSGDEDLCRHSCQNLGRLYHRLGLLDLSIEEHEEQLSIVNKDVGKFKPEDVHSCKEDLILAYLAKYNSLRKGNNNNNNLLLLKKGVVVPSSSNHPDNINSESSSTTTSRSTTPSSRPSTSTSTSSSSRKNKKSKSKSKTKKKRNEEHSRTCLSFLNKAYDLALTMKEDKTLLSRICLRIGKVHQRLKDYTKAMKYLLEYREICDELGDTKGSGIGDKHIARIIQMSSGNNRLGGKLSPENYEKALNSYKSFLEKSRKSGVTRNIGKSCERIGYLLILNQNASESVRYFQENYDLAKGNGDMTWMNNARIRLGHARGLVGIKDFLSMIEKNEIQKLLDWKDRREWMKKKMNKEQQQQQQQEEEEEGEGEKLEEEEEEVENIRKKKEEEEEEDD